MTKAQPGVHGEDDVYSLQWDWILERDWNARSGFPAELHRTVISPSENVQSSLAKPDEQLSHKCTESRIDVGLATCRHIAQSVERKGGLITVPSYYRISCWDEKPLTTV